jgi:ectoine hydroxylase-related dioxygenase (phytanoyl-CoA dioxygenase family)
MGGCGSRTDPGTDPARQRLRPSLEFWDNSISEEPIVTISEALKSLGVSADLLTDDERKSLDQLGFLHIPRALTPDQLEAVRNRQAELLKEEAAMAGGEFQKEPGTDRLANLVNKGDAFRPLYTHPKVLAAIAHVLGGDLKLSSLNSRNALPGQGHQALHADWGPLKKVGDYQVCNSIWLLDDFVPENGATRAVPGSHLKEGSVSTYVADPKAPHPDEKQLLGKAGDCFVFNSHTWHGGTLNRTDKSRRAAHAYFCRRHVTQQQKQREMILKIVWDRLSPAERVILDVE